jgi:hypothetical protein
MRASALRRVPVFPFCAAVLSFLMTPGIAGAQVGAYQIDIQGSIEILGAGAAGDPRAMSEADVAYKVIFRYYDPSAGSGPSWQDREAQVADGRFEIYGLASSRVYSVTVQRQIFPRDTPGAVITEQIPLDIPADFFVQKSAPPGQPAAPVEINLPIVSAEGIDTTKRSLSFFYNGTDLMVSALTEATS